MLLLKRSKRAISSSVASAPGTTGARNSPRSFEVKPNARSDSGNMCESNDPLVGIAPGLFIRLHRAGGDHGESESDNARHAKESMTAGR